MQTLIIRGDEATWTKALSVFDHDTYHSYAYSRLEATRYRAEPLGILTSQEDRAFFLPLLQRRIAPELDVTDATSPYGYPGPLYSPGAAEDNHFVRDSLEHAANALAEIGVCSAFVRGHPLLPCPNSKALPSLVQYTEHGETVWIDTSQTERLSWRGVRSSDKNRINKALRNGVSAEIDDEWAALPDFLRIYATTMDRVNANDEYYFGADYFQGLRVALGRAAMLCVVRYEGEVVAAGIFLRHESVLQFHLSGSRTELKHLSPARVMVDHMRRWATANGVRSFHLGGGLGARKDSLFEFKAGFSPLRATFWTWRLITSGKLFQRAVAHAEARSGRAIDPQAPFFPPYRFN